ncbi:MAG: hypothetical protein EI684_08000 [Candidatus Viridilinea halotolerans]|uniref:META domain-containing protein n=1 Tax=Candidatus Viridilinea halotolerans TaxID=2491704 RepID=A0A426U2N8_9CHLR|nr:MAG: hypothetical protein EI684_08000 [Candidatus Viridilinea halotolerans]
MQQRIVVLILVITLLTGCSSATAEPLAPPTPTPDPLAGLFGQDWVASVANVGAFGVSASMDMTMVFYRNGDVRADVPPVARYTGKFALADEGLLRFDWEEEILLADERRSLTEFWQFDLRGNRLILTNDETGEERIFSTQ